MPDPGIKVWAEFPGVEKIESVTYTRSLGIRPGVARLQILPQPDGEIQDGGSLILHFGDDFLEIPNCKVDQGSYVRNASGYVVTLSVWDRRWKWMFGGPSGPISGSYNILEEVGTLKENFSRKQVRTPRQLAELCLEAMEEVGYDISNVPDDPYSGILPEVQWDRENPMKALDQVCQEIGFVIALTLDDTVSLYEMGDGEDLPDDDIEDAGIKVNPPERPDSLMVVCAPTLFQVYIPLEAVGRDVDGTIKPIDQLSYKPKSGWSAQLPLFQDVDPGQTFLPDGTPLSARELAKQSVFRWYRVQNKSADLKGPLVMPGLDDGFNVVQDIRQILPMKNLRIERWVDPLTSQVRRYEAVVFGIYYDGRFTVNKQQPAWLNPVNVLLGDPAQGTGRMSRSWSLNGDLGIVEFSDYIVQMKQDGVRVVKGKSIDTFQYYPASLWIQAAVTYRDPVTWAFVRYEESLVYPDGSWGTGPRVLKHDEIENVILGLYDTKTAKLVGFQTNEPDVVAEAAYYLDAADQEYQNPLGVEACYMGLKFIDTDGAIQQVEWSWGPDGATTRASRNTEFAVGVPSLKQRRLQEQMLQRDVVQTFQELTKRMKAAGGRE